MPILRLDPAEAQALAARALEASGASVASAASTARALVGAEIDGQTGHGLARIPAYAAQVKAGKVDGHAVPAVVQARSASLWIDAGGGFAYPALDLAIERIRTLIADTGSVAVGIRASHHVGQAGAAVERLADLGLIALLASNTPAAVAFHGGAKPMMAFSSSCPIRRLKQRSRTLTS